jgi:hypothetical protein
MCGCGFTVHREFMGKGIEFGFLDELGLGIGVWSIHRNLLLE